MSETENSPKELLHRANALAASDSAADHDQLLRLLDSKEFLFSLEPRENYDNLAPKQLQVARIIKTLMVSKAPVAKETIVRLIDARNFVSLEQLEDLVNIALAAVRPLPPRAVDFLDSRSVPESAALHLVMMTLGANESEEGLRLFERKLADPEQEMEDRIIWLRVEYLTRRNDVSILRSYRRMIVEGSVPAEIGVYALESLCSYKTEWYLACTRPNPPLRALASEEAKAILREILTHAKGMALTPELSLAVQTTWAEIGGI